MKVKLGRNLFAKTSPDRPVHDLYSFALGAYIMIVMSSLLNTTVQKYQMIRHGMIDWNPRQYIYSKIRKVEYNKIHVTNIILNYLILDR